MKIYFAYLLLIFIAISISVSCNKDDEVNHNTTNLISIDSLVAGKYTIRAWDTTAITCYATGDSLVYSWECDHGSFNGSGTQIRYAAGECCIGINTITCEVSNRHGNVYESLQVKVTSYFEP